MNQNDTDEPQVATIAWLVVGYFQYIAGVLQLSNDHLSFVALRLELLGPFSVNRQLQELEKKAGRPGMVAQLKQGEESLLFEFPLSQIASVRFPKLGQQMINGGKELRIVICDADYGFVFTQPVPPGSGHVRTPTNPISAALVGWKFYKIGRRLLQGKRAKEAWKAALKEK